MVFLALLGWLTTISTSSVFDLMSLGSGSAGPDFILSGSVVAATDKAPIRYAIVTLNPVGEIGRGLTTAADEAGRFTFAAVPVGRYELAAAKVGWLTTKFGSKRPGLPGTPIYVGERQPQAATIALFPGAVVEGRVINRFGEPLEGVTVSTHRFAYSPIVDTKMMFPAEPAAMSTSDASGMFRIFGLTPGDYYIRAIPASEPDSTIVYAPLGGSLNESPKPVAYAATFYPAAVDPSRAILVALQLGEQRSNLDINLQFSNVFPIRGVVTPPADRSQAGIRVTLRYIVRIPSSETPSDVFGQTSALTAGDGSFIFNRVTPGTYVVEAALPGGSEGAMVASSVVDVSSEPLDIRLEAKTGVDISGQMFFEGDPQPSPSAFRLFLRPVPLSPGFRDVVGIPDGRGRVLFRGVLPGNYRVGYSQAVGISGWVLREARLGQNDLLDGSSRIDLDTTPVEMVLAFSNKVSEVSGVLTMPDDADQKDYGIVIFSTDEQFWKPGSRRVRFVRPDADGRYSLRGLPTGSYFLAVVADAIPGSWFDSILLRSLKSAAVALDVKDGQKTTQDLRIRR